MRFLLVLAFALAGASALVVQPAARPVAVVARTSALEMMAAKSPAKKPVKKVVKKVVVRAHWTEPTHTQRSARACA